MPSNENRLNDADNNIADQTSQIQNSYVMNHYTNFNHSTTSSHLIHKKFSILPTKLMSAKRRNSMFLNLKFGDNKLSPFKIDKNEPIENLGNFFNYLI